MNSLLTTNGPIDAPQRVLVVCAHPDDVDFGAAGTIAALTQAGSTVAYCLVTSGEAGSDHLDIDLDELAALRQSEQRTAAHQVGVDDLSFLGHPDGQLIASMELRGEITEAIREFRPNLVITHSPDRFLGRIFASHPDHLATGEATICAVYPDSRNPRAFKELLDRGLLPHVVPELWLMAHPTPDLHIDVTDTLENKFAALRSHESQMGHNPGIENVVREWLGEEAEKAGFSAGRFAEAFKRVITV